MENEKLKVSHSQFHLKKGNQLGNQLNKSKTNTQKTIKNKYEINKRRYKEMETFHVNVLE